MNLSYGGYFGCLLLNWNKSYASFTYYKFIITKILIKYQIKIEVHNFPNAVDLRFLNPECLLFYSEGLGSSLTYLFIYRGLTLNLGL